MPSKLNSAADLKLPTADRHVYETTGQKDGRNVGFKGVNRVSPDEDVVDEFAGKGETMDNLVGLPAPNI